jgi:hypothetical protein
MLAELGYQADEDFVNFLSYQLNKNWDRFPDRLRDNTNTCDYVFGGDKEAMANASDEEIVKLFVEMNVKSILLPNYKDTRRMLKKEDSQAEGRQLAVECGNWYSTNCLGETDIRYDPDASNIITDQNPAWSKFDGLYEATAINYGPDGLPKLPSQAVSGTELLTMGAPFTQTGYNMFINITLAGSRYYEQAYIAYPPAKTEFCNTVANNSIAPGVCGVNGMGGFFERFGTSSFEKNGQIVMLPLSFAGLEVDKPYHTTLPNGETNHFADFKAGDLLVQYASACLDQVCDQFSTSIDYYDMSTGHFALVGSTRIFAKRVASPEAFYEKINDANTNYNIPPDRQIPFPMKHSCLGFVSGFACPTEKDWCQYDPNCAESPYQEPEAYVSVGPVFALSAGVSAVLFIGLFTFFKKREAQKIADLGNQSIKDQE